MKYSVLCKSREDVMNRWTYAHCLKVTIETRYGDKNPRVYVVCEDGSEDVIDLKYWDCEIVVE